MATPGETITYAPADESRGLSFADITAGLAQMIGSRELRRRINRVAIVRGQGQSASPYYRDIVDSIESYFLSMVPGVGAASQARADEIVQNAKHILDQIDGIPVAQRNFYSGPKTQRHMVMSNSQDTDDEPLLFVDPQESLSQSQEQPRVWSSQYRQLQHAMEPLRMPSGLRQTQRRNRQDYDELDALGGSASGSKKSATKRKPKPKKRKGIKSKGKKRVVKSKK